MSRYSIKRSLNSREIKLADNNPEKFSLTMKLAAKAILEEEARYLTSGEDRGNNNAFLHAYWSCLLARNISEVWAKKWTDAHEDDENLDDLDKQMDLYNNGLGLELAKNHNEDNDEFLAIAVEKAISKGKGKIIISGTLKQSSNVGIREKNIFSAIYKKILSIVIELLSSNQLHSINADSMTPLMVAIVTGFKEAVEILIPHSDIEKRDRHNKTVLMYSIDSSNEIFKLILDASAAINDQDDQGKTALMFAAINGDKEKLKELLDKGANVYLKMKNNMTAYDLACVENHLDLAKILKDKMNT